MMKYVQLTSDERYTLARCRAQRWSQADIARFMGRSPSTISRELRRNATTHDGAYRADKAIQYTQARRARSRRNRQFSEAQFRLVIRLLRKHLSPEQISATLYERRQLSISAQTIYAYLRQDRKQGGRLYRFLRQAGKQRRKRYRKPDSRGKLRGKRSIHDRPPGARNRSRTGHWEGDTVMGAYDSKPCIVTLVDRRSKYVHIGKLRCRKTDEANRRIVKLIERGTHPFRTITADNGTEFHQYQTVEERTGVPFYFCTPYHSWERGLSENTNGLIRQFLPKRQSMKDVSQRDCDRIAHLLNTRPRKALGYRTPEEAYGRR